MEKQSSATPEKQDNSTSQPIQLPLEVRIKSIRPEGKTKAYASMNIAGQFAVDGIKIIEGAKGTFVSIPSTQDSKGQYRDTRFPVTAEFRNQISSAVLSAYKQELGKIQSQAAEAAQSGHEPAPESAPAMAM